MTIMFYIRRFILAFAIAAIVIAVAQMLKGHPVAFSVQEGLLWGGVSSVVYTFVLAFKLRKLPVPPKDQGPGTEK